MYLQEYFKYFLETLNYRNIFFWISSDWIFLNLQIMVYIIAYILGLYSIFILFVFYYWNQSWYWYWYCVPKKFLDYCKALLNLRQIFSYEMIFIILAVFLLATKMCKNLCIFFFYIRKACFYIKLPHDWFVVKIMPKFLRL